MSNSADADPPRSFLRAVFVEGSRFWERARILYNAAQLLLTIVLFALRWPDSRLLLSQIPAYLAFALVSNLLYSSAYFAEAILLIDDLRPFARRLRWLILLTGTVFACFLAFIAFDALIAPQD